jgi:hypothetical protein
MVYNIKKSAIRLREELEILVFELSEIIENTDALKVIKKAEDLKGMLGYDERVSINASGISYGGEAISAVEEYLNYYEKLKAKNKLDYFNLIKSKLLNEMKSRINEIKITKGMSNDNIADYRIIPPDSSINIRIKYTQTENYSEIDTQLKKIKYSNEQEMVEIIDHSSGELQVEYRWCISGDLSNRNSLEKNAETAVWIISRTIDPILIAELTK